jgi:hypothetical protein
MWNKMLRVSEWLVNLLSLALLIYISAVLMRPHARALPPGRIAIGHTVPISDVNWSKSPHTPVLALQTTCRYCAASAPFYKELLEKRDASAWQAVAVLPQPVQKSTAYMQAEGYSVSDVRQMNLGLIGVAATPTLLLVNQKGRLEKEWVGQLTPSGENQVAEALGIGKIAQDQPQVILAGMGLGGLLSPERGQSATAVSATEPPDTGRVMFDYDRNAPVQVVQVLEGTTDVTARGRDPVTGIPYKPWTGKPFQAGTDWLKKVVIVFENFSNKEVTATDFQLLFPQTGTGKTPDSPVAGYTIAMGRKPDWAMYTVTGRKHSPAPTELEPFSIPPGQKVRIALAPFYDAIKAAIEPTPISTINAVRISSGTFYFPDGTRWSIANFEKPDPVRPGAYIQITREEWSNITGIN